MTWPHWPHSPTLSRESGTYPQLITRWRIFERFPEPPPQQTSMVEEDLRFTGATNSGWACMARDPQTAVAEHPGTFPDWPGKLPWVKMELKAKSPLFVMLNKGAPLLTESSINYSILIWFTDSIQWWCQPDEDQSSVSFWLKILSRRRAPDDQPGALGLRWSMFHVALWRELAPCSYHWQLACWGHATWNAYSRADWSGWEVTQNSFEVWEAPRRCSKRARIGPLYEQAEVSQIVGDPWIPTQRSGALIVRPWMGSTWNWDPWEAWAAVNRCECCCSFYRQIPIQPGHRGGVRRTQEMLCHGWWLVIPLAWSQQFIITTVDQHWSLTFWGGSFMWQLSTSLWKMTSMDLSSPMRYDAIHSAFEVVKAVHVWSGAKFDQKKLQLSASRSWFWERRMTFSFFVCWCDWKAELIDEIEAIVSSQVLSPGQAEILRGLGRPQNWPSYFPTKRI